MIPDQRELESTAINGLDLVLMLMNVTTEIVASMSPDQEIIEARLTQIANNLDGLARQLDNPRQKFLMAKLAHVLIATEPTA